MLTFTGTSILEPVQNLARSCKKPLIFEKRSAVYIEVNEQRIAENQRFLADIVEIMNRLLNTSNFKFG